MGAELHMFAWVDNPFHLIQLMTETALWVSSLDLSPDESTLLVGTLTAGWGGPLRWYKLVFDMEDLSMPVGLVGNWHNWEGSG